MPNIQQIGEADLTRKTEWDRGKGSKPQTEPGLIC